MFVVCLFCSKAANSKSLYPIKMISEEDREVIGQIELTCVCDDCLIDISERFPCPDCGRRHVLCYDEGQQAGDEFVRYVKKNMFLEIIDYLRERNIQGEYYFEGEELML